MEIQEHDTVIVPDPNETDLWNHSFSGTVIWISSLRTYALVEDQENTVHTIELERLTLEDED